MQIYMINGKIIIVYYVTKNIFIFLVLMLTDDNIFRNLPQIETERLFMRKLTLRDANDIFEYAGNPETSRTVLWDTHRTIADSMQFINMSLKQYKQNEPANWGLVLKEN